MYMYPTQVRGHSYHCYVMYYFMDLLKNVNMLGCPVSSRETIRSLHHCALCMMHILALFQGRSAMRSKGCYWELAMSEGSDIVTSEGMIAWFRCLGALFCTRTQVPLFFV